MNKKAIVSDVTYSFQYVRVSGAEHQKDGLSLDYQRQTTTDYATRQPGWAIHSVYEDIMTGAKDHRPAYQRMLADVRKMHSQGHRTAVVTLRLDRLGRHLLEQVRAREELQQLGTDCHFVKDGGVLPDLQAHIMMAVAQEERRKTQERVQEIRSNAVRSGWSFGKVAFGYRLRPATPEERSQGALHNVITPDPATRGIVREAFERFASGDTVRGVSRWLSTLPAELRGGRKFPHQTLIGMLGSPTYVARPAEGDENVLARPVARWEPIITDELWSAVQARLSNHAVRPHQSSGRYLLTGFLRCSECGMRMVAMAPRPTRKNAYKCTGHMAGADAPVPGCAKTVLMPEADAAIRDAVSAVVAGWGDPTKRPGMMATWQRLTAPATDTTVRLRELDAIIRKAQSDLADAGQLLIDTRDQLVYEALRDRAVATIQSAEAERKRLQAQVNPTDALPNAEAIYRKVGSLSALLADSDVQTQRTLIDPLIESCIVVKDRATKTYVATINWTELGKMLKATADETQ